MKPTQRLTASLVLVLACSVPFGPRAQGTAEPAAGAVAAEFTDGEIRKVDTDSRKLTIRHGPIRNLGMPGMTMLFDVKDPAMLAAVKVGDKVRFKVDKTPAGLLITEIEAAR